jgi:hypothetical protein
MGIAALGFALWSLYDGAVKYPRQRERALALRKLMEENRVNEWEAYARERGWPAATEGLGEPRSEGDIWEQYVMAAVAGAIGLWLLWGVWRARGTWIESTASGITSSWGKSLEFDEVLSIDKRKWRSKGIAKVTYRDNGRQRRFIIDDYKFERQATGQILRELESKIDPEKITGGPPEALPQDPDLEVAEAYQGADQRA